MTQTSIYWARGFSAQAQTLQAIAPEELHRLLVSGDEGLASQGAMLRQLAQSDPAGYQQRKRFLPYYIAATFREGIRRIDHLQAAHGWTLDLDHSFQTAEQFAALREQLWRDPRVWLLYVSPSGQGLKLLFRFAEPLTGSKAFSDAYQAFARQFARQYELGDSLDFKTHDVTRVSFLSHDPEARLRSEPLPLQPLTYLQLSGGFVPVGTWQEPEKTPTDEPPEAPLPEAPDGDESPFREDAEGSGEPSDSQWEAIRQALGQGRPQRRRQVSLPAEVEALSPAIIAAAQDLGLTLKDTLDLNYGRKFVFAYQHQWAEVNVYYGKHGFSVVRSPKSGSHPGLREVIYDLVHQLIFDPEGLDDLLNRNREDPPWGEQ